jgi:AcrR family transcriptional regulator
MKTAPRSIGSLRREQIVEAAVGIITEQGLQNLSLSAIEQRAGMSRGQLTYYFPTKEDILLAVFDRLLALMCQQVGGPEGQGCAPRRAREILEHLLERVLGQPPLSPEFHALQYTFLSQIGHRADFRERLANLYGEWRNHMAADLALDLAGQPARKHASPRALATLIQAILHGLAMQYAADPAACPREEMLHLCLDVLGTYLWDRPTVSRNGKTRTHSSTNGASTGRRQRPRADRPRRKP